MDTKNTTPRTVLLIRGTMSQIMAILSKAEHLTLGDLAELYRKNGRN